MINVNYINLKLLHIQSKFQIYILENYNTNSYLI